LHFPDSRLVKELGDGGSSFPRFSPDGRWLAVSGGFGRLYAVDTWEPGLAFSGRAQFSPDGRLLAVSPGTDVIRLFDIDQGRELARLTDPHQEVPEYHCFTPDGTRLITVSNGKEGGVHVWDLRAIRRQLQGLNVDWNAPDYPPAPAPAQAPLRLEILP
jgi:hypothetical protein